MRRSVPTPSTTGCAAGPRSAAFQNLLAARDLRRIFAYRQRELTRLLG